MDEIEKLRTQFETDIDVAQTLEEVESLHTSYLGRNGHMNQLLKTITTIPNEKKKEFGQILNEFKQFTEAKYEELRSSTLNFKPQTSNIDLTLPGDSIPVGTRHPISLMTNRIISIFQRLGFAVAEGPEIEDDWHNFTALNLPEHHPARDMQDTFYVQQNPDWLLRTHTSNIQIREMQKGKLPIRIICPGRVYRNETVSARSHCFFHQVEGLYIDENVSFADLKQTLYFFAKEMYGGDVKIRFRPSYFPFTEPSAEMDISCMLCKGAGCNVCKKTGWLRYLAAEWCTRMFYLIAALIQINIQALPSVWESSVLRYLNTVSMIFASSVRTM